MGRIDLGGLSWRPRASFIVEFQDCVSRIGHGVERRASAGKEQERPAETPRAMVSGNRLPSQPPRGLVKSNPGCVRIDASPSALTSTLYSSCASSPRRRNAIKDDYGVFSSQPLFPPMTPAESGRDASHHLITAVTNTENRVLPNNQPPCAISCLLFLVLWVGMI